MTGWPGTTLRCRWIWLAFVSMTMAGTAAARDVHATPANYRQLVAQLVPGDSLLLAPGDYLGGLSLSGKNGSAPEPIVIQGARPPGVSRFLARPGVNTISLRNVSHVVIDSLVLDGLGLAVDAVKAEGDASYADHVTLSRLTIVNHGADRQIVGISTKCAALGWIVRDNTIVGAGTGMYFGNSDGSAPFVGGLIERNLIIDTIGYNVEIKHQLARPTAAAGRDSPRKTIVRRNVFVKAANSSTGRAARPNLLIGHLPIEGPGSEDSYLIYGNAFLGNPSEALLQAEGNVAIYNNVFINRDGDAIVVRPHNHRPRNIALFNNTVIASGRGVLVSGVEPGYRRAVYDNLVFAGRPLIGVDASANLAAPIGRARSMLIAAGADEPFLDLALRARWRRPLSVKLAELPQQFTEADLDFRGDARTEAIPGAFVTANGSMTAVFAAVDSARVAAERASITASPKRY